MAPVVLTNQVATPVVLAVLAASRRRPVDPVRDPMAVAVVQPVRVTAELPEQARITATARTLVAVAVVLVSGAVVVVKLANLTSSASTRALVAVGVAA